MKMSPVWYEGRGRGNGRCQDLNFRKSLAGARITEGRPCRWSLVARYLGVGYSRRTSGGQVMPSGCSKECRLWSVNSSKLLRF